MASSYVEVRETENNNSVLPFGLEACDENGIPMSSQLDGDLPKDHTYTKEPDIVLEDASKSDKISDQPDEAVENSKPVVEKVTRSQRNVRPHKIIKSTAKMTKSKKDGVTAKKESISVPAKKATQKQTQASKDTMNDKGQESTLGKHNEKGSISQDVIPEVENGEDAEVPSEQSKVKRKGGRKRKIEEKENIAQKLSFAEALTANTEATIEEIESGKPKRGSKKINTTNLRSPKKIKVVEKEQSTIQKTKGKNTPTNEEINEDGHTVPEGWTRKVVVRKSGKTAGQVDVYIYSPEGMKFRSKPDIAAYLARTKSNLKLDDFNFSKRTVTEVAPKATKTAAKKPKAALIKSKEKQTSDKKKTSIAPVKRGQKLLVKLKFPPPSKRGTKNTRKTAEKNIPAKKSKVSKSPVKASKASGSGQKGSPKKKTV